MRRSLVLLLALAQTAGSTAPGGGSVRGTVQVIDHGKVVAHGDVYVYLESTKRHHHASSSGATAEIRQVKQQFVPQVVVVSTGTTVAFPNYDVQEHNVFSPSD